MREQIRKENLARIYNSYFRRLDKPQFEMGLGLGLLSLGLAFLVALGIAHMLLSVVKS